MGGTPAAFYGRACGLRAAPRFYVPPARKRARFRGMENQDAFTARLPRPRGNNGGNFTIALLSARSPRSNSPSTAPFRAARPLPLVSTGGGRHLIVVTAEVRCTRGRSGRSLVKSGLKRASLFHRAELTTAGLGNCVFNPRAVRVTSSRSCRELVRSYAVIRSR